MKRTVLCFGLFCLLAVSDDAFAAPRLNKWIAMEIGLAALRDKYPDEYSDLVLKYRPFVAKFSGGVWQVYGSNPIKGMAGGAPTIEVRDRDEKILKIYFVR